MSKNMSEKLKTPEAKLSAADLDFEKLNGLLPVIAQDESSGAVLMLAYANREAVQKTQETGYAHYWSRSRDVLWKKGESSLVICRKLWKCWWIVIMILCFTKSINPDLRVIQVRRTVFSGN